MYILRAMTDDGIKTFPFQTIDGLEKATEYVMRTSAKGFTAEVDSEDAKAGKVIKAWDHKKHLYGNVYRRSLKYDIRSGAYRDDVWGRLGTEEECLAMAKEQNDKITCWADTHCNVEHIVGVLWVCVYTRPFTD